MKDKVIIITGASSGIGRACAYEFGKQGAKLAITGRNSERLDAARFGLQDAGIEVMAIVMDVQKQEDCIRMVDEVMAQYGQIDILVNNAGISMRSLFEDLDMEVFRQVMDVNFWGAVYCTKYALPHILEREGSVVGVSSIAGYKGIPARTAYSASKFAMHGFLESLRIENLKKGLHVLIACPGFTESNIRKVALTGDGSAQTSSPRDEQKMMSAEEVAAHMAKAIIKRKRSMVLTSDGILTVLLNKFMPAMLDKMVFKHFQKEEDSPI